ncbi:MAG: hypothetical protein ABIT36_11790 [Steroidobacteraceae bacterium]
MSLKVLARMISGARARAGCFCNAGRCYTPADPGSPRRTKNFWGLHGLHATAREAAGRLVRTFRLGAGLASMLFACATPGDSSVVAEAVAIEPQAREDDTLVVATSDLRLESAGPFTGNERHLAESPDGARWRTAAATGEQASKWSARE